VRRSTDDLAYTHLRFEQRYQGLPVWPAMLDAHFNPDNELTVIEGAYDPTPALTTIEPRLTAERAIAAARASVPGGWAGTATAAELVVYAPLDAAGQLGWKLDLNIGYSQAWRIVIDAQSGRVLHRSSRVFDAGVNGSGLDMTGATRQLHVWQQGNTYFLLDSSKLSFVAGSDPVQKPEGAITIADARHKNVQDLKGDDLFLITSTSPSSWDNKPGVSAAFNFSETYDYYLERHNRNSLDGNGGSITAVVQVGSYDNASWNGNLGIMLFGEVKDYPASLDVIGHELTHGVTEKSANLVYELQPGAMNESMSDIFGEMVEARTRGHTDWIIGTDLNEPFRNMKNPGALTIGGLNKPYPSKMSEFIELPNQDNADHGGVHINSSIFNHAFYLTAEGLQGALGLVDAARVFHRALTVHLQAQSQFVDGRLACLNSAAELFGQNGAQVTKVGEAFDAVEILAAPTTPAPPPVPVVQGPDSTLFIFADFFGDTHLARREQALGDGINGTILALGVKFSRPAVSGDGSLAMFVDSSFDLCGVATADGDTRQCLGFPGEVHAVALSPDGSKAAFILRDPFTGDAQGEITVVNLNTSASKTYSLVSPALDGVSVDQVLNADAMTFSTDSSALIYDAVSALRFGNGPTVLRWSIYALDLTTDRTAIVVPPIEGVDTGNPSVGRAGQRYLTLDARLDDGDSGILVLDTFTGEVGVVGSVAQGLGYPCFLGDESSLVFATRDALALSGFSLVQQALSSDRLQPAGDPALLKGDALLGVNYRRGDFIGENALPSVTLNSSTTDTPAPANLVLTATATDTDGSVAKVEFYNGANLLGQSTTPVAGKFQFSWNNVAAGSYRLIARAYDNLNAANDSEGVNVVVRSVAGPIQLSAAPPLAGVVRITVTAAPGNYFIQRGSDLKTFNDLSPVTIGAGGTATVDDPISTQPTAQRFYRARRAN
jgi:Zn-dependent metalloprotease